MAALDRTLRHRAALAYLAGNGGLSHTTALDVWGLRPQPPGEPIHASVPVGSGLRTQPGLVIHHRRASVVLTWRGTCVTRVENSLVDAWPVLPVAERPGPVIKAVNGRRTTPQRVCTALSTAPRLGGRAELRVLLDRLADGCLSALEIWGHDHVFTGPGMPSFARQVRIVVGQRTTYLDVYAERERVDIELDGAASHGDARQRETDLRRDALLATVGILVVRFSHARLTGQPDEVRKEVLTILADRRSVSSGVSRRVSG
ncbi:endonuclease domain-containing protein [Polymorphospora sp. A560]|uniref:endonuclease domain-containing protein n=1 Tax=Polymorphospora sp. A560 TaxID=3040203 RepID=UPI003891C630